MRDAELQARVSRLRQIIADAIPSDPCPQRSGLEDDAWRRFEAFAANDPLPAADNSWQAKAARKINRIAIRNGWICEIQRFLDHHDHTSISSLDDELLGRLLDRMQVLENCVRDGCDPPDVPAAR